MTQVVFKKSRGKLQAVLVSGHADYADAGEDIVCAAITSAVQLTSILLDDVLLLDPDMTVDEQSAAISITLPAGLSGETEREAQHFMLALKLHLQSLEKEYAQFINVMEVQNDA